MFYAYYILRIFQKKATTFRKGVFLKRVCFKQINLDPPPPNPPLNLFLMWQYELLFVLQFEVRVLDIYATYR